jgi:hypothetical protein
VRDPGAIFIPCFRSGQIYGQLKYHARSQRCEFDGCSFWQNLYVMTCLLSTVLLVADRHLSEYPGHHCIFSGDTCVTGIWIRFDRYPTAKTRFNRYPTAKINANPLLTHFCILLRRACSFRHFHLSFSRIPETRQTNTGQSACRQLSRVGQ